MTHFQASMTFQYAIGLIQRDQGLGIALVAAQKAQVDVTLIDTSQASIDKSLKFAGPFKSSLLRK